MQTHTPMAQDKLKSLELFLLIKRKTRGMLKNGNATAEITPNRSIHASILPCGPPKYNSWANEIQLDTTS